MWTEGARYEQLHCVPMQKQFTSTGGHHCHILTLQQRGSLMTVLSENADDICRYRTDTARQCWMWWLYRCAQRWPQYDHGVLEEQARWSMNTFFTTRTCCVHAGKIVRYLIDYLEHAQNLVYMFMYKVHRPDKVHDFTSLKSIMQ